MAQPTPPPITQTFLRPSRWLGVPSGPTKSGRQSPSFRWFSFSVVAPTTWKMIVTVPFSRSYPAIVSGMRSPSASARRMMNWPGFAFFAMSGASISIRVTVGFSASFFRIVYITLKTFLSVLLFYPCGAFSNAESCKKRRNAYSITEKNANYNAELSKSRVRPAFSANPRRGGETGGKARRAAGIHIRLSGF